MIVIFILVCKRERMIIFIGMSMALASLKDIGFDLGSLYGKSSPLGGSSVGGEKRSGVPRRGDFVWARIKSGCPVSCGGGK